MKEQYKSKITPYNSGKITEFICRMYMRIHGYRIIEKNYKTGSGRNTPLGEIDFIAIKKNKIVFCEVKKRKNKNDFLRALTSKQQIRIKNGAQAFMKTHKNYKNYSIQFDVFFIILPFNIRRIKNAFVMNKI